ncbi:hypothetical protein AVEN_248246-1 [Araneus ventricosus]|uniref:Uncharacterized protein n=1 Tax=Araneus ventricosus TaxID=182803 RepID=A0A4Y2KUU1_ARAVE|nr:hypothetical protein AVEN_248246-1 [Araneus ventricosus]
MFRVETVTYLLLLFITYGESNSFLSFKEDQLRDCYFHDLCERNPVQEYYKMLEGVSPEISTKVWEWISAVVDMDVKPENTLENCNKYRDKSCKLPEETQKKHFNEFSQLSGEYWMEICRDDNSPLCKEYSGLSGDCSSAALTDEPPLSVIFIGMA